MFEETPLLFVYFEACYYNLSFSTNMPYNMYGHGLGPAADVYENVQPLSPVTDTWPPHVIFFFLPSSSSLAERVDGDGEKQQQHAAERSSRPGWLAPRCRRDAPTPEPTCPQQPLVLARPQLCTIQQNI